MKRCWLYINPAWPWIRRSPLFQGWRHSGPRALAALPAAGLLFLPHGTWPGRRDVRGRDGAHLGDTGSRALRGRSEAVSKPSQNESKKMAGLWPRPAHDRNTVTSALPTASTSSVCWVGGCYPPSPNTSSGRRMNLEKLARLVKCNGIIKFSVDTCGEGKDFP